MRNATASQIEVFDYPASDRPLPACWLELVETGAPFSRSNSYEATACATAPPAGAESSAAQADDEKRRNFEAGRELGIREGRETEARAQCDLLQEAERRGAEQVGHLASQFAQERDRFLQAVEHEVVKLALAIAERILRRESQTDPLFLVGAVRVALGQLAQTLQVRLRVPASEASLWTQTFEHLPNLKVKPTVISDDSMRAGDCAIETEMGTVDLGLGAQLHQIESALFEDAPTRERGIRNHSESDRQELPGE